MQFSLNCHPNEKQKQFFTATNKYIAYGGARGGGKSWSVRYKSILLALKYPKIKILIMRKTFPELKQNHILPMQELLPKEIATYRDSDKTYTFVNGSIIFFGYCDIEKDINRYQGNEYDIIFLDEATHFTVKVYDALRACLRGVNGLPKRMYLTCNPGGVGHAWVKRLFVDKEYKTGENAEDFLFIKATVYDNGVLMATQPDYVAQLEALPEDLKQAWLYGEWDIFSGLFFPEFDKNIHVCKPFAIPKHWIRYRAIDYGLDMLACHWFAIDEQGEVYIYNALTEGRDNNKGANSNGHVVKDAARRILEVDDGTGARLTLAPPDLWSRDSTSGKSQADIFAENGVVLTKTSNERINGWMAVKELLRVENGKSKLHIFNTCTDLIDSLGLLQFDEKKVNDASNVPHEITHSPDSLRYFAIYWTTATPVESKIHESEWTKDMIEDYENGSEEVKRYLINKYGMPKRM